MVERTGAADPVRVLPLLWRQGLRAGRKGLTLDDALGTAMDLADRHGLESLTMRRLAEALQVGTMTVYAHVPGRSELIDLMVDRAHGEVRYDLAALPSGWRESLREVAEANWLLFQAHSWLLDVDTARPPLGPGTIGKYDAELRIVADTGLSDLHVDSVLTLVLEHVRSSARLSKGRDVQAAEAASDAEWWEQAGPLLAAFMDEALYPHAARVGQVAGEEHGGAIDPRHAYEFGLSTLLDGIAVLIERGDAPPAPEGDR